MKAIGLTPFSQVKMIVGSVTRPFTQVYDMTPVAGRGWWQTTLYTGVNDITYLVFVETDMPAGTYNNRLYMVIDSLE